MIVGDGIQEKKAIEDFTREANVLARLSHPGIPTLIDHFAENSRQYLVMEFVAGGDLQAVLDKLGPKGKSPRTASCDGRGRCSTCSISCTRRSRRLFIAT